MRLLLIILVLLAFATSPAAAQDRQGCAPSQVAVINTAIASAKAMTLKAASAASDDILFERWFGTFTDGSARRVRANYKSILEVIKTGAVTAMCHTKTDSGCQAGEYAFVYVLEPFKVHLCPSFFGMPMISELQPGDERSTHGTRGGTFIHELSHFRMGGGTDDHCYARDVCAEMADDSPRRAVDNADSYQYYAEDVTYFGLE